MTRRRAAALLRLDVILFFYILTLPDKDPENENTNTGGENTNTGGDDDDAPDAGGGNG